MKKALFGIGVLGLATMGAGQVRMYVTANGMRIGQAVASQRLLASGGKVVQLSMTLANPNGKTVTLRMETSFNSKGAPIRKFEESLTTKPRERRAVTVTFDKGVAHAVIEEGGNRSTRDVPLVAGAPIESKSEYWFIRDQPKVGDTDKYYHFDVSSLTWQLTSATYKGLKPLIVGGKKVQAHEIEQSNGMVYVDSKGLPYKLDIGSIVLERIPER
jgi:hypothetical protein